MARTHLRVVAVDPGTGTVVANKSINIYRPGTTTAPIGSMYNAATGGAVVTNPRLSNSSGVVEVWLDYPQTLDFVYTDDAGEHRITGRTEEASPPVSDSIVWASGTGNDSNDGLTETTAKATVLAAYDALPSTGGIVYIVGTSVGIGGPGIRIVGGNDPNWNAGALTPGLIAAGWRPQKRASFVGVPPTSHAANALWGGATKIMPSTGSGPQIDLRAGNQPMVFKNLHLRGGSTNIKLGYTSNGDAHGGTAGVLFDNVQMDLDENYGDGPNVQVGYAFWITWRDCLFRGNFPYTLCTLVEKTGDPSDTDYAFDTTAEHGLEVGDTVNIFSFTPSGYNSPGGVPRVVKSVPGPFVFVVSVGSDPGPVTTHGYIMPIRNAKRSCINIDETAVPSAGFWNVTDCNFNNGGMRIHKGTTSWGPFIIKNITQEGDFVHPVPPVVQFFGMNHQGYAIIENITAADTAESKQVSINEDAFAPSIVCNFAGHVEGPAMMITTNRKDNTRTPRTEGQHGLFDGRIYAQHDGGRRSFGPVAVRFPNLASPVGFGASATVTTGILAPDGSTNAFRLSTGAGAAESLIYNAADVTIPGDWLVAGVWARTHAHTGVLGIQSCGSVSITAGLVEIPGTNGSGFQIPIPGLSDEWQWCAYGAKVVDGGTELSMRLDCRNTHTMDYYGPVLHRIPNGTLTDQEVREFIAHLQSTPANGAVGDAGLLPGQALSLSGTRIISGAGSPAGVVSAPVGSIYLRTNGGAGTSMYVKESGTGTAGWVAK